MEGRILTDAHIAVLLRSQLRTGRIQTYRLGRGGAGERCGCVVGLLCSPLPLFLLALLPLCAAEDVLCVSVPRWPDKPEFPRALFLKFRSIIRDTLHCGVVMGVDLWQRHLLARCIDTGNQQSAATHIRIQLRGSQWLCGSWL